jgi:hypothetical protein
VGAALLSMVAVVPLDGRARLARTATIVASVGLAIGLVLFIWRDELVDYRTRPTLYTWNTVCAVLTLGGMVLMYVLLRRVAGVPGSARRPHYCPACGWPSLGESCDQCGARYRVEFTA